jgi:hypothetical protein
MTFGTSSKTEDTKNPIFYKTFLLSVPLLFTTTFAFKFSSTLYGKNKI